MLLQYFLIRLGPARFGINVSRVVEVLNHSGVRQVPELPDFVSGVITVRGELLPLIDMRMRLGITSESRRDRTLVVRSGRENVALLVDEVYGIVKVDDSDVRKPPAVFRGMRSEFLEGLIRIGEEVVMLMSVDTILNSDEALRLEETRVLLRPAR